MASSAYGSNGAGSSSTSTGGKAARPVNPRPARGQGIAVGPVTRVSTASGPNSGGNVGKVLGGDLWSGMRGTTNVSKVVSTPRIG